MLTAFDNWQSHLSMSQAAFFLIVLVLLIMCIAAWVNRPPPPPPPGPMVDHKDRRRGNPRWRP